MKSARPLRSPEGDGSHGVNNRSVTPGGVSRSAPESDATAPLANAPRVVAEAAQLRAMFGAAIGEVTGPSVRIENSPRVTAQRVRLREQFGAAPPSSSAAPVQRMVVATAPVNKIDRVIAADVAFQSGRAGGETLTLGDLENTKAGTHAISSGEWFIICGHGSPAAMDGVLPGRLAAGLRQVTDHEKTGGVYLSACNTATPDDLGKTFSGTFRERFLSGDSGREPPIIGATGYKINDFSRVSGEEQVAVPTKLGGQARDLQNKHWLASGLDGPISQPLGASSIGEVLSTGQELLKNPAFRKFFDDFVGDLKQSDLLEPDQLRDQEGRSIDLS